MAAEDHKGITECGSVFLRSIVSIVEAVNRKVMLSVDLSSVNYVSGP